MQQTKAVEPTAGVSLPPDATVNTKYAPDDFATFASLTGKSHIVQITPTAEEDLMMPGQDHPRRVPKRGTAFKVRFAEGMFVTPDPVLISVLLEEGNNAKCLGFGRDYDINRADPTGYWCKNAAKHGLTFTSHQIVQIKGGREDVQIRTGSRSAVGVV